jgi:hypothetical protein
VTVGARISAGRFSPQRIAAQRLRNAAGETDCDDGTPAAPRQADDVTNAFFAAVLAEGEATPPTAPGPSIRCNDCYAPGPADCPKCRTRDAARDARFNPPQTFAPEPHLSDDGRAAE